MALFDFLKRKEKEEKSAERRESSAAGRNTQRESKTKVEVKESKKSKKTEAKTHTPELNFHERHTLIAPHITEKSRNASFQHAYTFKVTPQATKRDVITSIESLYHVHVEDVRMVSLPSKPRRRGLTSGTKKGYKKAIVSLRSGESIDVF